MEEEGRTDSSVPFNRQRWKGKVGMRGRREGEQRSTMKECHCPCWQRCHFTICWEEEEEEAAKTEERGWMERSRRQWLCESIERKKRKSGSEARARFSGSGRTGSRRKRKERICLNINVVLMWTWNPALHDSPWIINCMLCKPKKGTTLHCHSLKEKEKKQEHLGKLD